MTARTAVLPPPSEAGPWGLPLGLALVPFAPLVAAPWVGYDVLTVRGAVLLAEVACVFAVATPARLADAWRAVPLWARAALAVWLAWMGVTTLTAVHPGPAALRTAEWVGHLALAAAVWGGARHPSVREAMVRRSGGAVLLLSVGAVAWWCAEALGGGAPRTYTAPLAGARNVGVYALLGLALWLAAKPREGGRAVWWAGWCAGWAVLAWTGGRASFAAALVLLVAWAALGRPSWRVTARLAAAGAAGVVASLPLPHDAGTGLGNLLRRSAAVGDGYASGRGELWVHVVEAWRARPWLGLGGDGPAFVLADHTYAHNTVVQALGEWGLVGAAAFGALLLGATWTLVVGAWRSRTPALAALAAGWLAASANGLLDGVFYGALPLALLAVIVGAGGASVPGQEPAGPARRAPFRDAFVTAALALVAAGAVWHLAASAARYAAGSPPPSSLQARVALSTTTTYRQTEILWWARDWARDHPADAFRAARWGQRHSRTPWAFLSLEGDLRAAAGDSVAAADLWRRSGQSLASSFPVAMARAASGGDASGAP